MLASVALLGSIVIRQNTNGILSVMWPQGKKFAFTIVDDTDWSTVENTSAVYNFLYEKGFLTTKTVWPLSPKGRTAPKGHSLENEQYKKWILSIRDLGYEIALHGIADDSSTRGRVVEGLERFKQVIGHAPRIHINHMAQAECLYWGGDRFDGVTKQIYNFVRQRLLKSDASFLGHIETSEYFWGDLCRETVTFVRNFVFNDINTLKNDLLMPYHDPQRPYVPFWFSSSAAHDVDMFCNLISEENQDRLIEEGGACIVYTHLAFGFYLDGKLNQRFVELMYRLAGMPGWFVPASTLLEHVGDHRGWQNAGENRKQLKQMSRRWLFDRVKRGNTE